MRTLSTDSAHGDGSLPGRRDLSGRFLGAILPAVAAAALGASLLLADLAPTIYEVRAIAPAEVPPGAPLPVRAAVFTAEAEAAQAEPVDAAIRVWLEARASGFRTEPVALRRSLVLGSEGALLVPEAAPAAVTLVIEASVPGGVRARARRRVRVHADAARPPMRAPPRTDLERLALGPIRAEGAAAPPPDLLEIAVPSGSCVPELPCRLVLAVDESVDDVAIDPAPQVELVERSGREATVVVRGPEGSVELVAWRAGAAVARREVRLPLAPGGVAVDVRRPVVRLGEAPGVVARSLEDGPLAVDLFRDGRWTGATSVRVRALEATAVPLEAAHEGVHRVQVQRHVLVEGSADRAGVALFTVRGSEAARSAPTESAAEVVVPPAPFGGASVRRADIERSRVRGRLAAALVVLAAGVLASALLLRRGVGGARAELLGYVLLVFVAFAAVAAFLWRI